MTDDEPFDRTFIYRSYYEPTTGIFYKILGEDGIWRGQKIPTVLAESPPDAPSSVGLSMTSARRPVRRLRRK